MTSLKLIITMEVNIPSKLPNNGDVLMFNGFTWSCLASTIKYVGPHFEVTSIYTRPA
jgi:hypothetical protein